MPKQSFIERKGYQDGGDISSPEKMTVRQAFDNYTSIQVSERSSWGAKSEFDKVLKHLSKFIDVDTMTLEEFNTQKTMDRIFNSDTMLSGKVQAGSLFTPEEVAKGDSYSKTIRKEMALKIRPIINELLQGHKNAFTVWNGKNSKIKNTKFKDKKKYPNAPDSIGFKTRDGDAVTYVLPSPARFQQAIYKTEQKIESELKNNKYLTKAGISPSLVKAHMFLSAVTGMRGADIKRLQKNKLEEVLGQFDNETKTIYIGNKGKARAYALDPHLWSILTDAIEQATHKGDLLFPKALSTEIENFYLKLMTQVFDEENIPFPKYDLPTAERHAKLAGTSIEEQRGPRKITHNILRKFTFSLLESLLGTAAGDEIIQHKSIGTKHYRALQAGEFQTLPEVKAQNYWWKHYADVNDISDFRQYFRNNKLVVNANNIATQIQTSVQELAKDAAQSIKDSDTWSKLHTLGYNARNITWLMKSRANNAVDYAKLLLTEQGANPSIDEANKVASVELDRHIEAGNQETKKVLTEIKDESKQVKEEQGKSPVKKTKRQLLVQNMALKVTELADDPESIDFNLATKFADQFKNEDELIAFLDKKDEGFRQTGKFSIPVDNTMIESLIEGDVPDTPRPRMSGSQYKNIIRGISAVVATGASLLPGPLSKVARAAIPGLEETAFGVFDPTVVGEATMPLPADSTATQFADQVIDRDLFQQKFSGLSERDVETYLPQLEKIASQRPLTQRETNVDERSLLEGIQARYPEPSDTGRIDKGEINRWRNIAGTPPTYREDEHRYTEEDYSSLGDERRRSIKDIQAADLKREDTNYQDQMSALMSE
mgnify:FL=1